MSEKEITGNQLAAQSLPYATFSSSDRGKIKVLLPLSHIYYKTFGIIKMFIIFIDWLKKREYITYGFFHYDLKKWSGAVFPADMDQCVWNRTDRFRSGDEEDCRGAKMKMREITKMALG